jgi:hypothetical protein
MPSACHEAEAVDASAGAGLTGLGTGSVIVTAGHAHQLVPPDVLTGVPPDWTGVEDGACRLLELPESPVEELLSDEPEPAFDVPELPGDCVLPEDPVLDEPVPLAGDPVLAAACVLPGSMIATTPAAATLAIPTAAVVLFTRCLPCSRSATARDRERAALRRAWAREDPLPNSGLLMIQSVAGQGVQAIYSASQYALILRGARP